MKTVAEITKSLPNLALKELQQSGRKLIAKRDESRGKRKK